MFTGLVQEIGFIKKFTPNPEGVELEISAPTLVPEIQIDDSVSVNGVCQTATQVNPTSFIVQAVHTTLEKTTLGKIKLGGKVNLELALRPQDRLGGHFVSGHVNGLAELRSIIKKGKNWEYWFNCPSDLLKYIVKEGSVTLDGVSLTIADCRDSQFMVSLIPHTLESTTLGERRQGDFVNIEADLIAKYLEGLLNRRGQSSTSQLETLWNEFNL